MASTSYAVCTICGQSLPHTLSFFTSRKQRPSRQCRLCESVRLKAKIRKPWFGLLGYTVVDLKRHLERQFSRNMTWANHGTYWHIDHVIPVSLFDFTTDDGVKACWALSNLRPLEAKANIKKNNKRTHLL